MDPARSSPHAARSSTLPLRNGRIVTVAANSSIRYREARFLPDGKSVLALSTETGETEFWKFPANGDGKSEQWTKDAHVLRSDGIVSPDGNWLAHYDKDQRLWIFNIKTKEEKQISQSMMGDFNDLRWSPDSRWLAYVETAANQFVQIKVLNVASGDIKIDYLRSVQQRQPHMELRRQMDVFPFRPHAQNHH